MEQILFLLIFPKKFIKRSDYGIGFYFTSGYQLATEYGNIVMPVYLSIQNPFYVQGENAKSIIMEYYKTQYIKNMGVKRGYSAYQRFVDAGNFDDAFIKSTIKLALIGEDFNRLLKAKGFDGIISDYNFIGNGYIFIAFSPNQIKSVNNKGTWKPNSSNIYENIIYATTWKDYDGEEIFFTVEKNPTDKEFWDLLNHSKYKQLKGIAFVNSKNLYVWDSFYGTHNDVYTNYIEQYSNDSFNNWNEIVQLEFDKNSIRTFGYTTYEKEIYEKYYDHIKPLTKSEIDKLIASDELGLLK